MLGLRHPLHGHQPGEPPPSEPRFARGLGYVSCLQQGHLLLTAFFLTGLFRLILEKAAEGGQLFLERLEPLVA
jgi:hypothetical protein